MKHLFIILLLTVLTIKRADAQYEFYIKSLVDIPKAVPSELPGKFLLKKITDGNIYYEFTNSDFPICYYPPDNECGYFEVFGKKYSVKGKYDVWEEFGCNLDGETFSAYQLKIANRSYVIITSIAVSNGRGTRNVFCQLFDVTDKKNIAHYPLWSIYGSYLSFGDYNHDGRLDFLEVRNELSEKNQDTFRLQLKTLSKTNKAFEEVNGKFILFQQEYINNKPKISIVKKNWQR